jgi:hypothetical protein
MRRTAARAGAWSGTTRREVSFLLRRTCTLVNVLAAKAFHLNTRHGRVRRQLRGAPDVQPVSIASAASMSQAASSSDIACPIVPSTR